MESSPAVGELHDGDVAVLSDPEHRRDQLGLERNGRKANTLRFVVWRSPDLTDRGSQAVMNIRLCAAPHTHKLNV